MPEEIKTEVTTPPVTTPPVTPPVTTPPVTPPVVDDATKVQQTKAYSDLHNSNKALKSDHEKLQTEFEELKKQIQTDTDKGKDVSQLMEDLNVNRTKAEAAEARNKEYDSDMQSLIESAMETLTDQQKALVENASENPFKRLRFINALKEQSVTPVVVTSAGGTPGGDVNVELDVDFIISESNSGRMGPYRAAKTKYGVKKLQEYIAKATKK